VFGRVARNALAVRRVTFSQRRHVAHGPSGDDRVDRCVPKWSEQLPQHAHAHIRKAGSTTNESV